MGQSGPEHFFIANGCSNQIRPKKIPKNLSPPPRTHETLPSSPAGRRLVDRCRAAQETRFERDAAQGLSSQGRPFRGNPERFGTGFGPARASAGNGCQALMRVDGEPQRRGDRPPVRPGERVRMARRSIPSLQRMAAPGAPWNADGIRRLREQTARGALRRFP